MTLAATKVGRWAFAAAAYSNDAPFLANEGTSQTLLPPEWIHPVDDPSKDVLSWIFDEKVDGAPLRARYPQTSAEFLQSVNFHLSDPIIDASQAGSFLCNPPFVTPETEALCEASINNSRVSVFRDVHHPVQYCHSAEDTVVPRIMTDGFLVGPIIEEGGTAMEYKAPLEYLTPRGSHIQAKMFCSAAIPTFLSENSSFLDIVPIKTGYKGGWLFGKEVVCPALP